MTRGPALLPPGQDKVWDRQRRQASMELLGYVFAWILGRIVPSLRAAWGNLGCLLVSILAAGVLVFWFLPARVLDGQGGDWKTWLIVGSLATIAVVVMVAETYGLARGSRSKKDEMAVGESHGDQEPAERSIKESLVRDIKAPGRAMPETILRYTHPATNECPYCAATLNARAIVCWSCGRNIYRLRNESTSKRQGQGDGDTLPGAVSGGEPILAGKGGQTAECTHCGTHNAVDSAFCGECGAPLDVAETE
jgi:hypothetical protein